LGISEASSLKAEEGAEAPESLMLYLSPGEREVVEAVEKNIAKPGFEVKIRWTYIAKRDKFFKPRGVSGVMGIFSQFKTVNLNSFIPDSRQWSKFCCVFCFKIMQLTQADETINKK